MDIKQAKKLAGGVLAAVGVKPFHQDYEDYKQELLLLICKTYNDNNDLQLAQNPMLFKFLKWRLLDILRKVSRYQKYVEPTDELPPVIYSEWEQLNLRAVLEKYMSRLDKKDSRYQLMEIYLTRPGYLMNDYCKMLGIHRTTARRRFDSIKADFKAIEYDK